ncbi:MAG: hypothetical protein GKC04_05185 [Methanomicrobiales archaeon]|nr:hypothetical protein [Methanomicrobiales archaeon]
MGEQFIFTKCRTVCYHCGEDVDQIIKVVSPQAQVVCSNCGATRIFTPRTEDRERHEEVFTHIGEHEIWNLDATATCKNCGVTGPHDMIVGSHHLTTRCRNCGYAHYYRFDLEYIGQCPIPE